MNTKWFGTSNLIISVSCMAMDALSFVLGPLLSLNQLCDRGNFRWFDCSQGHYLCEGRWNMKLTQRCSWNWTRMSGPKRRKYIHTLMCGVCPAMLNSTLTFLSPLFVLFPVVISSSLLLLFLSFQTLFWYIIDPLKGSPDAQTHPLLVHQYTHRHTHTTKYVDFCQLNPVSCLPPARHMACVKSKEQMEPPLSGASF